MAIIAVSIEYLDAVASRIISPKILSFINSFFKDSSATHINLGKGN